MKLNHILEGIEVLSIVGNEDIEVLNPISLLCIFNF